MQFEEVLSVSGIFKILEILIMFITVLLHRFGDYGLYLFFGTTSVKMAPGDPGMDVENLGNGALMTGILVSSSLLASYILDGRYHIQRLFLETFWNCLICALLMGTGVETLRNWASYDAPDDYTRDFGAGIALGSLCILGSIIYFCDFVFAWVTRNRLKREPY
ncbi:unnamed protein product [Lepeophtheirus salmonis]|uniref:(salmon louse) hypothetical protein n=1 Tax=Lepeophtheirus salmonis TaxID=72036 RepID=A0A7R8H3Q0_LEPSM|nr:unnamed protein product [Lepeophtheirus salmonis]CAF2848979.1 unnamed protein product [Lepeophtheirus salmonis]